MGTVYLQFATVEEAQQRSAEAWEARLGRPRKPDDVTKYLFPLKEGVDGSAILCVNDKNAEFLKAEDSIMISLDEQTYPPPRGIDEAIADGTIVAQEETV